MYHLPNNPGIIRPSRMRVNNGTLYAMPYWIVLENEAHWKAVLDNFEKNKHNPIKMSSNIKEHNVLNYVVTEINGSWSCTCKGYQFRRRCRHIDHIKDGQPLENKEKKKPAKKAAKKQGKTFTNPFNANQTYTVGQRGRKPAWVLPLIEKE